MLFTRAATQPLLANDSSQTYAHMAPQCNGAQHAIILHFNLPFILQFNWQFIANRIWGALNMLATDPICIQVGVECSNALQWSLRARGITLGASKGVHAQTYLAPRLLVRKARPTAKSQVFGPASVGLQRAVDDQIERIGAGRIRRVGAVNLWDSAPRQHLCEAHNGLASQAAAAACVHTGHTRRGAMCEATYRAHTANLRARLLLRPVWAQDGPIRQAATVAALLWATLGWAFRTSVKSEAAPHSKDVAQPLAAEGATESCTTESLLRPNEAFQ